MVDGDGKEIRVGSYVSFKDDIETSGKVSGFRMGRVLVEVWCDCDHDYRTFNVDPKRCWQE
jgi:phosphoribosyl-AMP cyclohydrolase